MYVCRASEAEYRLDSKYKIERWMFPFTIATTDGPEARMYTLCTEYVVLRAQRAQSANADTKYTGSSASRT